ncbi:transketolase C-terminal domain-containing protein [Nonomuraea sp. NPDC002799]
MRVGHHLNLALHDLLDRDPAAMVLGEDIVDPYGGAFKITKGLSTRHPGRVLATPLSEGAIVGAAAGLALAGNTAIVEIMFGDFVTLAFDQIVNFATKSVSMYGRRVPMPLLVRCPVGGRRGYGPTHSQNPQKHFVGVPGLSLYELSPFHQAGETLGRMLARGEPGILFEDKVLYTRQMFTGGRVDDIFGYAFATPDVAMVSVGRPEDADCVVIAPGGMTDRVLSAMRSLLIEEETSCLLLVPDRLYPFDLEPLLPLLAGAKAICVVEDGTAGGTWGTQVAHQIHSALWHTLRGPVTLVSGADSVIPTAPHLESRVLVQDTTIRRSIVEALHG